MENAVSLVYIGIDQYTLVGLVCTSTIVSASWHLYQCYFCARKGKVPVIPRITEPVSKPVQVSNRYDMVPYCTDLSKIKKKLLPPPSQARIADPNQTELGRTILNRPVSISLGHFWWLEILDHFLGLNRTNSWLVQFGMPQTRWFRMVLKTMYCTILF